MTYPQAVQEKKKQKPIHTVDGYFLHYYHFGTLWNSGIIWS